MTRLEQLLAFVVMLGPALSCVPLARAQRPGRGAAAGAVATVLLAVVWDVHKAPYEGPVIVPFTATHGLTVVDLVVPVSLAVAAAVLVRHRRG